MSLKRLAARPLAFKKIKTIRVFPSPPVVFNSRTIDFDGDGTFGNDDLHLLSKRHFREKWSIGDGHCFFRVLNRYLKTAGLYTQEELRHFEKIRSRLEGNVGAFPEITYLRRLSQKFCLKIPIDKYGRKQAAVDESQEYASQSQAYGLAQARLCQGTSAGGYADSPDYEACATILNIVICILQVDGKWQVFPDDCIESGFGSKNIMFAYNSGAIHFNSLFPVMENIYKRKEEFLELKDGMTKTHPTLKQTAQIMKYFPKAHYDPNVLDGHCDYIMNYFSTNLDTAIEMLYVRRKDLIEHDINKCIENERKIMLAFNKRLFIKLMTYGSLKTKAGFKNARELMLYLAEKNVYLTKRDNKPFTLDQVAEIYLNGD